MPAAKPTVYLIGGCNGAGKTTFAKEFLPSIGVIRFLNADEIARGIDPLLKDYAPLANKWFLWDNSMPPAKLLAESATHTIIDLRSFFSFHEEKSV